MPPDASDPDVYPMPLFPRLQVSDLTESTAWLSALGFETVFEMPAMVHVRYRKYADVMLVADEADGRPPVEPRGAGVSIHLTVADESVDDVAARARNHGERVAGPEETSWNTREVTVESPDGYVLVFSEPVDTGRSFEDVMGQE